MAILNQEEQEVLESYLTHACGAWDSENIPEGGWPEDSEEQVLINMELTHVGHNDDCYQDHPHLKEAYDFLQQEARIFYCEFQDKRMYMSFGEWGTGLAFYTVNIS